MAEKFFDYMVNNGFRFTTILLLIIIIAILSHIEQAMILVSKFYGLFASAFSVAHKKQISLNVRGNILKSIRNQQIHNDIIIPDLRVVWINKEEPQSFVNDNQVIVRIKHSSNQTENLVTAVSEYVNNGLLYNVRRYLDNDIINVSKVLMTKKILEGSSKSSLTYFSEHYLSPIVNQDPEIKELYNDLVQIDNNGMFVGILLNEFNKSGMSIYGQIEDPLLVAESKEFMRYLYNIAIRLSQEPSDLCFNREYFKIAIFLSANDTTLKKQGIQPFINVANKQLTNGITTIYVFGLGRKREIAELISKEIQNDYRIYDVIKHSYKHINPSGKRTPGVFFECNISRD